MVVQVHLRQFGAIQFYTMRNSPELAQAEVGPGYSQRKLGSSHSSSYRRPQAYGGERRHAADARATSGRKGRALRRLLSQMVTRRHPSFLINGRYDAGFGGSDLSYSRVRKDLELPSSAQLDPY
jgi:hypothetical protein